MICQSTVRLGFYVISAYCCVRHLDRFWVVLGHAVTGSILLRWGLAKAWPGWGPGMRWGLATATHVLRSGLECLWPALLLLLLLLLLLPGQRLASATRPDLGRVCPALGLCDTAWSGARLPCAGAKFCLSLPISVRFGSLPRRRGRAEAR
jgi:hypothetical protein